MKTEFGKELASIRLQNNLALKDMASGLGVPPSFLSAVESNKKALTDEFLQRIFNYLVLPPKQEDCLRKKAAMVTGEYIIDTTSLSDQNLDVLTVFARRLGDLSEEDRQKISTILNAE